MTLATPPNTLPHDDATAWSKNSWQVLDVDTLRRVHPIDRGQVLGLHDLSLELLGGSQLTGLLGKVNGQDHEFLDLESVVRAALAVLVRGRDGGGHGIDPGLVVDRLTDLRHIGVEPLRARIQVVRAGSLAVRPDRLQRHQGDVILALVAEHHDLADAVARLLDLVLDRHWGDVLAALADDQLFVAACDLDHPLLGDHTLVPRVQPTIVVDCLRRLLLDLRYVGRAQVRRGQVAHHDVAAAEAQLALVLLVDVGERAGALHLGLRVEVLFIDLEGPDLDARHLRAAGAPLVHLVRGHGAGAGALRHAVDLVDGEAQRAEVLEGVDADGRRTREAELALVQPQTCLHLGQNRIGRRKAPRHSAAAT
mmetsp:Transcript_93714/g.244541  ORF Transcript_93714/g.244541 Transcript_93714/m.244541 type:complete len:365 (-) Transcript_93714:1275-2369(-)